MKNRGGNQNVLLGQKNKDLIKKFSKEIIYHYQETFSVSACVKKFGISYSPLAIYIKSKGIYRDVHDTERCKKNYQRVKKTFINRYGYENNGQSKESITDLKKRNSIDYKNPIFLNDFFEYRKLVEKYTGRNKKHLIKSKYCYYTGIKFSDSDTHSGSVNPNDHIKRTLDHKISIFEGFLNNIDPYIIGGYSNLVYCLRYCNSIKGNMSASEFVGLALKIREKFLNENYESN
jgi:hypothetical protein